MDPRQRVTDLERLILFFAGVGAVFLAAMAWGGNDVWLLIYAAGLAVVVGGAVLGAVIRRRLTQHEIVTARVLSASEPRPQTGIVGHCDLRLEVFMPGQGRVQTRHRAHSVPLSHWPKPGQWLPVQISGGSVRRLRIRWNLQDAIVIRKPGATDSAAAGTEEAVFEEEEPAVIYSPTPPRPRKATPQSAPAPAPAQTEPPLYEDFTDEPPVRTSAPASVPYPTTVASNGNDPDGYDPANFEPVQLREVDPATIDLSDFSFDEEREPPTVPPPAEELAEPTVANDSPPIPQPRGGTEPATPDGPPPPTAWILPHGASRGGTGLGATLPVADLARSLHFYHDQLGFTIAYTSPESAVVELEGTRILLEHVGDAAGREPQYDQVHMAVGDIDATCASLAASGVDIIDPPATADANDGPQLWRATLSDPDGHEVELVEWRVPRR